MKNYCTPKVSSEEASCFSRLFRGFSKGTASQPCWFSLSWPHMLELNPNGVVLPLCNSRPWKGAQKVPVGMFWGWVGLCWHFLYVVSWKRSKLAHPQSRPYCRRNLHVVTWSSEGLFISETIRLHRNPIVKPWRPTTQQSQLRAQSDGHFPAVHSEAFPLSSTDCQQFVSDPRSSFWNMPLENPHSKSKDWLSWSYEWDHSPE